MRGLFGALLATLVAVPAFAGPSAHWIQLGPGGAAEVRAVVASGSKCPTLDVDGARRSMSVRAAASDDFPLTCAFSLPRGTSRISLDGESLRAVADAPRRIVVLGDTGCRIKPPALQDCNDATAWPFPEIAQAAASLRPDLVIHVGDYLYRESACPTGNKGCAGSPWGDNWNSWAADFFTPAAPLLSASPWVIVRGNHEVCARAGEGFLRLLGPQSFDPGATCSDHLASYAVEAGSLNLVVLDDSAAPDTSLAQSLLPALQADFASLATIAPKPQWLLTHRPIWGLIKGPLGVPVGGNLTMITAAGDLGTLAPVELLLSGHIHTFEAINYVAHVPPQILAGHGGDNLDPTPTDLRGAVFQGRSGVSVKDGVSVGGFGFLLLSKVDGGWNIDLYKVDGSVEGHCLFAAGRVDCSGLGKPSPPNATPASPH
jgi:calcineurin-like phosphoesterase family protein